MTSKPTARLNAALKGQDPVERKIAQAGWCWCIWRRFTRAAGRFRPAAVAVVIAALCVGCGRPELEEATIAGIHSAIADGRLTCRQLVDHYLARIDAFDQQGPALHAIVSVNPNARNRADELDARLLTEGLVGPLHCVPMIVKDNFDTGDMPTTAGSLSLEGSRPPDDAFQVRRIRDAGAVVLAKSNMAEFAFSAYETLSSVVPGHTRNPYSLHRVPAGSSGGTAVAVAAEFGLVGLGSDTGNSIRGPSSHSSLVGIRSTMGMTSRDGIVPLDLSRDIGGPMGRTVEDVARVFDIVAGSDPNDPVTREADARRPESYLHSLRRGGLREVRIGVLRQLIGELADAEVVSLFDQALVDMQSQGAVIVDPVEIRMPEFAGNAPPTATCGYFRFDLETYLGSLGEAAPVRSLADIIASGAFHGSIEKRLVDAEAIELAPADNPACAERAERSEILRQDTLAAFEEYDVAAMAYPTWNNPPRLQGDLVTPHGNNSPRLSPPTGFPSITVPMGYSYDEFPAGLQLIGLPWSEATLFALAYDYEQATRHRIPPASTPPLRSQLRRANR